MKLSIRKKDDIETIVSIICLMMQMEWGMEVHMYDTLYMNPDDEIILLLEQPSPRISRGKRVILQEYLQQAKQDRHIYYGSYQYRT